MPVFISRASSSKDSSALAPKLWELWKQITDSPYTGPIPPRFRDAVNIALEAGYNHIDLTNGVHYASFLKPTSAKNDATRVYRILRNFEELDSIRALSVSLAATNTPLSTYLKRDVQPHPNSERPLDEEGVSLEEVLSSSFSPDKGDLESLEALSKMLRVPIRLWSEYEFADAISIIDDPDYNEKDVKEAIRRARKEIGLPGVLPSDLVRAIGGYEFEREFSTPEGDEDSYLDFEEIDEEEAEEFDAPFLHLDEESVALVKEGVTYYDDIIRFHRDVPEGYWEAVSTAVSSNENLEIAEVYLKLKERFDGFTPGDREKVEDRD